MSAGHCLRCFVAPLGLGAGNLGNDGRGGRRLWLLRGAV